jgi:hypothetical protein
MTKQKKNKAPEGFPKKDWDKLSETWKTAAQSKQTKELEKDLIESIKNMSDISFDIKNDVVLQSAKEEFENLKSYYTMLLSAEKAKADFCMFLLKKSSNWKIKNK